MPKMRQNAFGGRPDPMGERSISPRSLAAIDGVPNSKGKEKRNGRGEGEGRLAFHAVLGTDF